MSGADGDRLPSVSSYSFGTTRRGEPVERYSLVGAGGMEVSVISYGARVQCLLVPGRGGDVADVVLGYDDLEGYEDDDPYHGAVVGRFANRIRRGRFELDGREYQLTTNHGEHHLHGGEKGFSRVVWEGTPFTADEQVGVELRYHSPDGEEGYPGNLDVRVTYTVSPDNRLRIDYAATTDRPTPVNLLQHLYLNLGGHGSGDVLDHELQIRAREYTPLDSDSLPTGEIAAVEGTPLDFRTPRAVGERIRSDHPQMKISGPGGYDHNFVIDAEAAANDFAARVRHPPSGRTVDVRTSEPGLQVYTGNLLDGHVGKDGHRYNRWAGLCLETQHFADAPNHPHFPSTIVRPGDQLRSWTVYAFGVEG
jgi:aldose 1-epimerase